MCQLQTKFKFEAILESGKVLGKGELWFDWRTYFFEELQVDGDWFNGVGVWLGHESCATIGESSS